MSISDEKHLSDKERIPPIVSIVGKSNSGKTTFLEKLIREMKMRGIKLGVVKHDAHKFEIDHPGKDSYRLKHAGADVVLISSSTKIAMVKDVDKSASVFEIRDKYLIDVDLVLTEGYKRENTHKIEISRHENSTELLCKNGECIAMVTDWSPDTDIPLFCVDDVKGVADLIQDRFLKNAICINSSRVGSDDNYRGQI